MTKHQSNDDEIQTFLKDNAVIWQSLQTMRPDDVEYPEGKNDEASMENIFSQALDYYGKEQWTDTQSLTHLIVAIVGRSTRDGASENFGQSIENMLNKKVVELEVLEDEVRHEPLKRLSDGLKIIRDPNALEKMRKTINAAAEVNKNTELLKKQRNPGLN